MASRSLGSFFPDALQDELNQVKEPDDKYYHIEFQKDSRREINPFKLRDFLSAKCGQQIDKLTVDSKDGFSFQVKSIRPQNALFEIDQFNDITCKISLHNYLNECKGLMYIQNFEFNDDFKEALKKEYPYIKDANAADFIKTKNEATTGAPFGGGQGWATAHPWLSSCPPLAFPYCPPLLIAPPSRNL